MGSSTVMMCSLRVSLIRSMMAARVVDLPWPVGPVTRMNPRGSWDSSLITGGMFNSSTVLMR